jgi:hypothetical protein|tara:strand:+ start:409 stop:609 length:201 start_codon:yes stop_codon:yes gene_type:complete
MREVKTKRNTISQRTFKIGDRVTYLDNYQLGTVYDFHEDDDGFNRMEVELDNGEAVCKMFHWFVKL